jgi:hypothetical protein
MPAPNAPDLFESGRSHGLSAVLLYQAARSEAEERGLDVDLYAFNGTYSLSVNHLLGLGLELMLKAAIVALRPGTDDRFLRDLGHDLIVVHDTVEGLGFRSDAEHLREILEVLREPYQRHYFRYQRPAEFPLPGDFNQVGEVLRVLDEELHALLGLDLPAR